MKGEWRYSDAKSHQCGLMVCCSCNKKITSGEFRSRMDYKLDGYQCQHRECSKGDPEWARLDAEEAEWKSKESEFESDCKVMSDKYGIDIDYLMYADRRTV